MDAQKRARFLEICRERSFERKRVVLASGRESDFFIDCKQTILTAEGHALVGELLFELLAELPRSGDPLVRQRHVGGRRVQAPAAPVRLAVPDEPDGA